jgi:DNA-binding response OmpR family regulator
MGYACVAALAAHYRVRIAENARRCAMSWRTISLPLRKGGPPIQLQCDDIHHRIRIGTMEAQFSAAEYAVALLLVEHFAAACSYRDMAVAYKNTDAPTASRKALERAVERIYRKLAGFPIAVYRVAGYGYMLLPRDRDGSRP